MVKCGKSEGGLGHGRQVLQLAAFGDAALRQADLALAALQGRPHGEVRQEGRLVKVGVGKGAVVKCGKSEGRLGRVRLVGLFSTNFKLLTRCVSDGGASTIVWQGG